MTALVAGENVTLAFKSIQDLTAEVNLLLLHENFGHHKG